MSRRLICAFLANLVVLNFCIVPAYADDSSSAKPDIESKRQEQNNANESKEINSGIPSKDLELDRFSRKSVKQVDKASDKSDQTIKPQKNSNDRLVPGDTGTQVKDSTEVSKPNSLLELEPKSKDKEFSSKAFNSQSAGQIGKKTGSSYPKLNSLLNRANGLGKDKVSTGSIENQIKSSKKEFPNSTTDSYGTKDGLKELDSVRIARPNYSTENPSGGSLNSHKFSQVKKNTIDQPIKVAPNIVRHATPELAPDRNSDGAVKDKSDTRIRRPNTIDRASLPGSYTGQDTLLAPKESDIPKLNNLTADENKIKELNQNTRKPEETKTSTNLVPGLKPQTPVLANPSSSGSSSNNGTDSLAGTGNADPGSGSNTDQPPGKAAPIDITKVVEKYPTVGRLETLTFGTSSPEFEVGKRLDKLENSIFARIFSEDSLFDRTERLKRTLLGAQAYDKAMSGDLSPTPVESLSPPLTGTSASEQDFYYLDDMARMPENLKEESPQILNAFAEELINFERKKRTLAPLEHDELVQKMADRQMQSMIELKQLSHSGYDGQNPDLRYTKLGGVDAVTEGLVAASTADLNSSKLSKAAVCVLLKKMFLRQDDREALLAPEATHLATSFGRIYNGTKIYGCTEVLTRCGKIDLIGIESIPGEKVQISGTVKKPYKFDRITIAWEEVFDSPIEENPESDEALPYFPPLDYVAYSKKSEKDYSKAIVALKALGVVAAIAGGVFVPPVALAAPLIVMAGPSGGELKPQSDIPVKGGVKVHGSVFKAQIPLDNESQEGLYYVTVWASLGDGARSFPISRRVILVTNDRNDKKDSSQENSSPIEYTKESVKQNENSIDAVGDKDKDSQAPDNDKDESSDNSQGI